MTTPCLFLALADYTEFLKYGPSGALCLLALFSSKLISDEQKKEKPNASILKTIRFYAIICLSLAGVIFLCTFVHDYFEVDQRDKQIAQLQKQAERTEKTSDKDKQEISLQKARISELTTANEELGRIKREISVLERNGESSVFDTIGRLKSESFELTTAKALAQSMDSKAKSYDKLVQVLAKSNSSPDEVVKYVDEQKESLSQKKSELAVTQNLLATEKRLREEMSRKSQEVFAENEKLQRESADLKSRLSTYQSRYAFNESEPYRLIEQFYNSVESGSYTLAWSFLSPKSNLLKQSLEDFSDGYHNTRRINLKAIVPHYVGETSQDFIVYYIDEVSAPVVQELDDIHKKTIGELHSLPGQITALKERIKQAGFDPEVISRMTVAELFAPNRGDIIRFKLRAADTAHRNADYLFPNNKLEKFIQGRFITLHKFNNEWKLLSFERLDAREF